MGAAAQQWAPVKYSQTAFGAQAVQGGLVPGGLDLTTPVLKLSPGALRDMLNFEVSINGGYTRIQGYERFDGQLAPSSATYVIVQLASLIASPEIGSLVTQVGSGAQGIVASVVETPTPYLVLTDVTGVFDEINSLTTLDSFSITVGGVPVKIGGLLLTIGTLQAPPTVVDLSSNTAFVYVGDYEILIGGAAVTLNVSPN